MDCSEIQRQLVAWHDGELSSKTAAKIKSHLAECAACRGEMQQIEAVAVSADTWHLPDRDPENIWEDMAAQIAVPDLTDVLNEMRLMRQEMERMHAEVSDLRRQISMRPPAVRPSSPRLFPYAPPIDPPVSFH